MKKNKDDFKFSPADYDYMDNMPLEGWFWEIIRRSDAYQAKFREFEKTVGEFSLIYFLKPKFNDRDIKNLNRLTIRLDAIIDEVNEKIGVADEAFLSEGTALNIINEELWIGPICSREKSEKDDFCRHYLFFPKPAGNSFTEMALPHLPTNRRAEFKKLEALGIGLPRPQFKFDDFKTSITPSINHISAIKSWTLEEITREEQYYKSWREMLSPTSIEDTLYIGISRSANIKDIEDKLLPTIRRHLKPQNTRLRTDKWKYYLITYDLKLRGENYPEIADILSEAYPMGDNNKVFSEKNIEYYHKSARSLINGGYKRYMYPEK